MFSSLKAFFFSVDVLFGDLVVFDTFFFCSAVNFFRFLVIKARIGIQPKMLDPDPNYKEAVSKTFTLLR
jgi:hypothetical protein